MEENTAKEPKKERAAEILKPVYNFAITIIYLTLVVLLFVAFTKKPQDKKSNTAKVTETTSKNEIFAVNSQFFPERPVPTDIISAIQAEGKITNTGCWGGLYFCQTEADNKAVCHLLTKKNPGNLEFLKPGISKGGELSEQTIDGELYYHLRIPAELVFP